MIPGKVHPRQETDGNSKPVPARSESAWQNDSSAINRSVTARRVSRTRSERLLTAQFRIYAGACMRQCADAQKARFHVVQNKQDVALRASQ